METVTLEKVYKELKFIRQKVAQIERILIPEVEATEEDKKQLAAALEEYQAGKTVDFKEMREG